MSESSSVLSFSDEGDGLELTRGGSLLARIGSYLAIALGAYHLWTGYAGGLPFVQQRSLHLAVALSILMIGLMAQARGRFRHVTRAVWFTAMAVVIGFFAYTFTHDDQILRQFARFTIPHLVWAAAVALIGLELARRIIGAILPVLVLIVMGVILAAFYFTVPWQDWIAAVSLADLTNSIGYKNYGIMGSITGVSAGIVASFLVFGAMLAVSGGAQSFLNLARFAVGRYRGGPGKVSLITSAFFGTVSGSAVANVVVDGVFNIPLMKRSGFSPSFAAAVEATTSSGGQLVPPVMGAAAFIMAEFLGIPFSTIILAAVVPIVLFYSGLFVAIHVEAVKQGLPGIPKDQLPKARNLVNFEFFGSFGIPIGMLLVTLYVFDRSLLFASFVSTMLVIAYILLGIKEPLRDRLARIVDGLRRGGEDIARIVAIVVAAQLLISALSVSGIASRAANELAGANIPLGLSLVFLAIVVVILGFGVPTAAAYVLAASISTPIFAALGLNQLAGHLFILYLTVYANVTPPVMPATYAAVAIARADVMRAGVQGTRLLLPVLLVPFAFALDPDMLLTSGTIVDSVYGMGRMLIGMSIMAAGLGGYFFRPLRFWESAVLAGGAGLTAWPGVESTLAGALIASLVAAPILVRRTREGVAAPQTGAGVRIVKADGTSSDRRGHDWEALVGKARAAFEETRLPGMEFTVDRHHGLVVADGLSEASVAGMVAARSAGAVTVLVPPHRWPWDTEAVGAELAIVGPGHSTGATPHGLTALRPIDFEITVGGKDPLPEGEPGPHRLVLLGEGDRDIRWNYSSEQREQSLVAVSRALGILPADRVLIWHDEIFRDHVALLTAFATLRAGALLVVEDTATDFDPARWLEVVAAGQVSTAFVSTERLRQLVAYVQAKGPDIADSLSAIVHGGPEPADQELVREAIEAFGPIMIEYMTPGHDLAGTVITSEEWLEHEGSIGRTISEGCEVLVIGDEGSFVGPNTEGVLAFRHRPVARPDGEEPKVDADGLTMLRTGLRTYQDHDGYVYVRERVEATSPARPPVTSGG